MINLKSRHEIEDMGRGGAVIADLLREVQTEIRPGVSTGEIDEFCEAFIVSHSGAFPAFKGLYGFPGSVCISINDEVVHGIPSKKRTLSEGDIISIDVGVKLDGWCSDSAWTFAVGEVEPGVAKLMRVTEEALVKAIDSARPGNHVGDIGAAVMSVVEGTGFGIIRDLVGHGVGRQVHEEPQVPNVGRQGYGPALQVGMVLAIEPMLSGGSDRIRTLEDQWTVVTVDGSPSAHFEHTVAITEDGPRVLTAALEPAAQGDSA